MIEKYYMFEGVDKTKAYDTVAYYRCIKIEDFVNKVEKDNKIVGITFSDNNLGFIIDKKEEK